MTLLYLSIPDDLPLTEVEKALKGLGVSLRWVPDPKRLPLCDVPDCGSPASTVENGAKLCAKHWRQSQPDAL